MSKEIIDLLEKAKQQIELGCGKTTYSFIDQALTLLKQQPPTGEWTKNLRNFIKLYENEVPRRAEITFLIEACDIIDRAKAKNKDLLTSCKKLIENEPYGVTPYFDEALRLIESTIAKAKKEGGE